MNINSKQAEKFAKNTFAKGSELSKGTVIDIKDYLEHASSKAAKQAAKFAAKAQKAAPDIADSALHFGADSLSSAKKAFRSFGTQAGDALKHTGGTFHTLERRLLQVGVLYAVYAFFSRDKEVLAAKARQVRTHIETNPIRSVAIGAGVGYLIARLLK